MRLLQKRELLLDRADDSGIAGVGEETKRWTRTGASWAALASRSAHSAARSGRPRRSAASAAAPTLVAGSSARRSQR